MTDPIPPNWNKTAPGQRAIDLSDYARPVAKGIVHLLKNTPVRAWHVTLVHVAVGLAAAGFFLGSSPGAIWTAAILLQVKNILDAADGSLARAQNRPSRIGRFLDSLGDFVVNAAVYLAIGWRVGVLEGHVVWTFIPLAALVCAHLQCSFYNYCFVRFRRATGGDVTSRTDEAGGEEPAHERGPLLDALKKAYAVVYGWQDRLVAAADDRMLGPEGLRPDVRDRMDRDPAMATAVSFLGLGVQILLLDLAAAWGYPSSYFFLVLVPLNGITVFLLYLRRSEARRIAGTAVPPVPGGPGTRG